MQHILAKVTILTKRTTLLCVHLPPLPPPGSVEGEHPAVTVFFLAGEEVLLHGSLGV